MAKINKVFYKNETEYSDGTIEDEILEIVRENENFDEVLSNDNRWAVFYHLSHLRENILNWFPFKENCKILEVGAECGVLTGLFCKKALKVVAVELTEKRANIIYERHKNYDNLEIMVGNINNMEFEEKFDYIILNGVLEYAKQFTDTESPYIDFLLKIKTHLKKTGSILLAIENRLGLKYIAGFKEDHHGDYFSGINGYKELDSAKTFSKSELLDIIKNAGFENYKFFYPYPDYKFPDTILTDDSIENNPYSAQIPNYDQERIKFFEENHLNISLANEGISKYFSNSFLVELTNITKNNEIIFVKLNAMRKEEFRLGTIIKNIEGNKIVVKFPLSIKSKKHLKKMNDNQKKITSQSMEYLKNIQLKNGLSFPFIETVPFGQQLIELLKKGQEKEFFSKIHDFYQLLRNESILCEKYHTNQFSKVFGNEKCEDLEECHRFSNIDINFDNVFIQNGKTIVIDYEWCFDFPIPLKFILWRSINHFLISKHDYLNNNMMIYIDEILNHLCIDSQTISTFRKWDVCFLNYVFGTQLINISTKLKPIILLDNTNIFKLEELSTQFQENIQNNITIELYKDLFSIISEKNTIIAEKNGIIFEKNNIIFEKDAILKIYESSFIWRITKPVKWFRKVLRKIRYNPFIFIFLKSNIHFKKFINDFKSYNIIKNSKSFDENYYIDTYPLLKNTYMNLILHYMYYGYKEGKNPNAVFDTNFYLNTHHDVERLKLNPFIHYIMYGDNMLQNKSPNDLLKYYINKNRNKTKMDILFLSIIPYDYQYYQRPQHIANYFSELGHQVHYFNPTFLKEIQITSINKNIQMINLRSKKEDHIINKSKCLGDIIPQIDSYIENVGISDFLIFVEFPYWDEIVKYLKHQYNIKVVFDILDDFLGFHPDDFNLLNHTNDLINISDLSITTSNYLYDKVKSMETDNKLELIRNGTEFEHFNKYYAVKINKERFNNEFGNDKPIVGYYGAIADWFDFDKVIYLAEKRPEYNIILIGNITDSFLNKIENLKKIDNIKLLGPKDYKHIPTYLKTFDVAIIPFRSDLDLIKATNPVKFYEYLSMGKKIVATRMPELFQYENKFAYLTDNNDEFIDYIDKCVNGTDKLASDEEKMNFAKSQDWQERFKKMDESIKSLYDKVSIIIVTYNNLEYTKKCLNSIFKMTAYPNYEIIIVDNNSNDGSKTYLEKLKTKCNNVIFIQNDENLGFSKANNIGLKKSSGEYIILLNNDTIVTSGWISSFIRHLSKRKAIVGPVTNNIDNEAKIDVDYTGDNLEDINEFAMKCRNKNFNEIYQNIPMLAMFCLAMKRETFEDIGFLDETFEVGMFEDDDYSHRAKLKGYEIIIAEDIFIHHYGGASFFLN